MPGTDDQPDEDLAVLAAITDPVECAARITAIARRRGNLPAPLARLRADRLRQARLEDGRKVTWLALKVGLGISGISRLTRATSTEGAAA